MSTYTTSLGLEEITPGGQAGLWGNTTNTNLSLIDQAIAGVTPVNLGAASGSTYVLSYYNGAYDESRSAIIKVTGATTGPNIIQIPQVQKLYVFFNNSGNPITVQTALVGNTVTLANGESTLVFCDGFNAFPGIKTAGAGTITVPYGGTGATSFGAGFILSPGGTANLVSVPFIPLDSASAAVSGVLPVPNGGTGQASLTLGAILLGNGTGNVQPLVGGASGQVATWNGSNWTAATPTSGGVSSLNNGGNITLSGATGAITISLTSGNVTGALGFTPVSSTALSGYALLTGATFSGGVNAPYLTNSSGSAGILADGSVRIGNGNTTMFYSGGKLQMAIDGQFPFYYGSNGVAQKPGGGSWADVSDARLKDNVVPLTGALSKLLELKPVSYIWKYDRPGIPTVGFIAQEVQQVFPSAVGTSLPNEEQKPFIEDDKVLDIGFKNDITAYLVCAIQELSAKVDAQAAEIAVLKGVK
jgi:hypothetical protein